MKIGILGPESTGKSVLAHALQAHFGGSVVDEYARTYVEQHGSICGFHDVLDILEQDREDILAVCQQEHRAKRTPWRPKKNEPLVFFDAGLIIDKVWAEVVFGVAPIWMTKRNGAIPLDLRMDYYLLLEPDIAWEDDPARYNGDDRMRRRLYDCYLHEIKLTRRPYGIVSGQGDARTQCAINLLKDILGESRRN